MIARALAKSPADRFASATDMAAALRAAVREPARRAVPWWAVVLVALAGATAIVLAALLA